MGGCSRVWCVGDYRPRVVSLFCLLLATKCAMVLAALLSALSGVGADAYENPVPANMVAVQGRPSLRRGGPRIDSGHATAPLRFWHAFEPGPLVADPDGSDVLNAARVGGSRSADTTGRSGTAADEASRKRSDTTLDALLPFTLLSLGRW